MNKEYINLMLYHINLIQNDISKSSNYKEKEQLLFKIYTLNKAIEIIKNFKKPLSDSNNLKEFENIKGIGKGIIKRIKEYNESKIKIKTVNNELMNLHGINSATIQKLNNLNIYTINDLKQYYKSNPSELTPTISLSLKYYKTFKEHILREEMKRHKNLLRSELNKITNDYNIKLAGSYRRKQPYSNDIDVILYPKNSYIRKNILNEFVNHLKQINYITDTINNNIKLSSMSYVVSIDKNNKFNNRIHRRLDIKFSSYKNYPFMLLYFTGSKNFNQQMRLHAKNMNYKLNEKELIPEPKQSIKSEKDIFKILKLKYILPKDRNVL